MVYCVGVLWSAFGSVVNCLDLGRFDRQGSMKDRILPVVAWGLLGAAFLAPWLYVYNDVSKQQQQEQPQPIPVQVLVERTKPWAVFFSPNGGCCDALVAEIQKARKSVHVQSYAFTSAAICDALNAASLRVKVVVILDERWNRGNDDSLADSLAGSVEVRSDYKHPISHDKVVIIDGKVVVTGSYNHTQAAERNGENLLIIHDPELATVYERNFQKHLEHSKPWRTK